MFDIPTGGTASLLALQYRLLQTQSLPADQHKNLQSTSLQKLLNHAINTVPFYRDYPEYKEVNDASELSKLPILTRKTLQQKGPNRFKSENPPKTHGKGYEFRSSGSTGRPVKTVSSDYAQLMWRAFTYRSHQWAGKDLSKPFAAIRFYAGDKHNYPGGRLENWGAITKTISLSQSGPSFTLNSSEPLELQYKWLCEISPSYLLTYPSNLKELVRIHIREKKLKSLQLISTLGETVTPELRHLVRKVFGCKIHDLYSSQEVGYIALQCPEYDHYHIQSESCLVEILNEEDKPSEIGEMGRVIVTSLQNYIMPLIRYETGDYAIPGPACDCGISLPVLNRIIGRTRNLITYPDGSKSWPYYDPLKLMEILPASRFQIIQTSTEQLEMCIMSSQTISSEKKGIIRNVLQTALRHPFDIKVLQVKNMRQGTNGKFEEFISEI